MSELFGRKIEFLFDNYKITNDFTIKFNIPFDDGPDINVAEIMIYNLLDSTINTIRNSAKATLNAGYTSDAGVILNGIIKRVDTDWSSVDKITTITIADANDSWLSKKINKTYKNDITARQVLIDLISASGLKTGKLSLPVNKVYKGGKTINDHIGKIISEIAPDCNAKVHITRGAIYISGRNEGTPSGLLINKDSGLVSSPTPITKEEKYKVNKTEVSWTTKGKKKVRKIEYKEEERTRILRGWKVVTLLNHRIKTDSIIKVQSRTANGEFRVASGVHDGDSYRTEIEVYPL